jgi:hypothetical protein
MNRVVEVPSQEEERTPGQTGHHGRTQQGRGGGHKR